MVKQLHNMVAIVTFLEQNQLASGQIIYDGMNLKELAENTFTILVDEAQKMSVSNISAMPYSLKEKIGTLLSTKEMNPALYISPEFMLGIYLPILSPFIVPLILTLTLVFRLKLFSKCKKQTEVKEKTD